MFTGIIEELGRVEEILKKEEVLKLEIKAKKIISEIKIGESVSVNGVCLTTVEIKKDKLFFDCIKETIKLTNLSKLKVNELVNLERPLKTDSFLSGHMLLGHIDGMGRILKKEEKKGETILYIEANKKMIDYLVPKGPIALDGVSLTIVEIGINYFTVSLIPYTLKNTTLGFRKIGDYLNIEIDILAKYIKKFLEMNKNRGITKDFLKEHGFL